MNHDNDQPFEHELPSSEAMESEATASETAWSETAWSETTASETTVFETAGSGMSEAMLDMLAEAISVHLSRADRASAPRAKRSVKPKKAKRNPPQAPESELKFLLGTLMQVTHEESHDHPFAIKIKEVRCVIPLGLGMRVGFELLGEQLETVFADGVYLEDEDNTMDTTEFEHSIKGYVGVTQTALELFSDFPLHESSLTMQFFRQGNTLVMMAPIYQDTIDPQSIYVMEVLYERVR